MQFRKVVLKLLKINKLITELFDVKGVEKLGTKYGSWAVPCSMPFYSDSVVYSAGVGEDISFDLLLQSKYNMYIVLIDPTSRSKEHFKEIRDFFKTKCWKFSGNIQPDYQSEIQNLKPNFNKFKFLPVGVWKCKDTLKFYKQNDSQYVSQTLISNFFGENFNEVEVMSLKDIMEENNHDKIDLLKLDIEGAEIEVINQMLKDEIFPNYLCVEFHPSSEIGDEKKTSKYLIQKLIQEYNYEILYCDNEFNMTFQRKN